MVANERLLYEGSAFHKKSICYYFASYEFLHNGLCRERTISSHSHHRHLNLWQHVFCHI